MTPTRQQVGSVARKILNMPPAKATSETAADANVAEQEPAQAAERPQRRVPQESWAVAPEAPAAGLARTVGRAIAWTVVVLLLLLGVRTLVRGPAEVPAPPASADVYPESAAQGVAARFATNYLTVTPSAEEERDRGLALDVAAGSDVETEWAGGKRTSVANVYPAGIERDDRTAFVTVVGQMRTWDKPAKSTGKTKGEAPAAEPGPPRWVALSVPVQIAGERPVVAGTPAFVNLPRPGEAAEPPDEADTDTALTEETREGVTAFFRAYAGDDGAALEQASAPGASMQPLASGMELSGVTEWRVETDGGESRVGHATVSWTVGGATVKQEYRVQLAATEAGGATSWRVASVTAEA